LNEFSFRLHLMKILINFSIQMEKKHLHILRIELSLNAHLYWKLFCSDNEGYKSGILLYLNLYIYFTQVFYIRIMIKRDCLFSRWCFEHCKTHDLYTLLHRSLHLQVPVKYDNCVAVNFYNILNVFHYKTLKCYV